MVPESNKERKKNTKENDFLIFGFMENKKLKLKLIRILCILKLFNPYTIEEIK